MVLHLVVPALFERLAGGAADLPTPRLPVLELLLARGWRQPGPADYAAALFELFGVTAPDGTDLPTAPLCYLGDTGQRPEGYLLHADPVHLVPDQDRLLLFKVPDQTLSPALVESYLETFNQHFAADGLTLLAPHPDRWYLRLDAAPQLHTTPLSQVAGRNIDPFLPLGGGARQWRQYLNEVQMLFHGVAEASGLAMPVNALWFSGGGRLPGAVTPVVQVEAGEGPLLRGLALLQTGAPAGDAPRLRSYQALLEATLAGDRQRRDQGLRRFEAELAMLLRGGARDLYLYPCDGTRLHWRPRMRWRWWRRARRLASYSTGL